MAQFFADIFQRRTGKPLAYRGRRSAHRAAGSARRAEPSACLFRLGAAAQPLGEPGRHRASRAAILVWPAADNSRHAAADAQGAVSRTWCRKCRAAFARRCKGRCRCCASAGRWCGRQRRSLHIILSENRFHPRSRVEDKLRNQHVSDSSRLRAPCRGTASR